jgi:hypothetical protein
MSRASRSLVHLFGFRMCFFDENRSDARLIRTELSLVAFVGETHGCFGYPLCPSVGSASSIRSHSK